MLRLLPHASWRTYCLRLLSTVLERFVCEEICGARRPPVRSGLATAAVAAAVVCRRRRRARPGGGAQDRADLDGSPIPRADAQHPAVADAVRFAGVRRRRAGCQALPGAVLDRQRQDLDVQAASRRQVLRRFAAHVGRRGVHVRSRGQGAQQPVFVQDLSAEGGKGRSRRSAHRAASPRRSRIRCCRPTWRSLPILSAKAAAGPAPEGKTTTELNAGNGLVGAGPYKFVSWKRGSEIVFERNPHYWGPAPAWDKVIYRPISNPAARVAALLAGDVDLIEDPPTDDLERLQKDPKLTVEHARHRTASSMWRSTSTASRPRASRARTARTRCSTSACAKRCRWPIDRQALVARTMGGVATAAGAAVALPDVRRQQEPGDAGQGRSRTRQGAAEGGGLSGWLHAGAGHAQRPLHQRRQGGADPGRDVDAHRREDHDRCQCARRVLQEPRQLCLQRLPGRLGHGHRRNVEHAAVPAGHARTRTKGWAPPTAAATPTRRWTSW